MLRIKKLTDSIFPRPFDIALKSYDKSYLQKLKSIHDKQIEKIKKHYESKLLSLKNKVEGEIESSECIKIKEIYENDPYHFANKYNIDYQLSKDFIKILKSRVSKHFFLTKEEKLVLEKRIQEQQLSIISEKLNELLKSIPSEKGYIYEDTDESRAFEMQYGNNLEQYAKDFDLPLDSNKDINPSEYMFIYESNIDRKYAKIHTSNTSLTGSIYKIYLMQLDFQDSDNIDSQVIMYSPKFNNLAFFFYKNSLYQAEYNEFFTDEELLLRIKEKVYKEDKRFEQLKKQVELYESYDINESEKRKREPIPEEVRNEVWRRDQGRCVICGSQENLEFDHIIPFSKGGSSTARNIQLLCQNCNRHKSDKI